MTPRPKLAVVLIICLAAAAAGLLSACGEEAEELHAVEGEPLELGPLSYTVQITRFLNRSNPDDATYLRELEEAPAGQEYLAVFMRISNETDQRQEVPDDFEVVNSRGATFEPIELDSPFALQFDEVVEPEGEVPALGTPARSGPIKGSMVLFLIDRAATENRPLELEITPPGGETGSVELDI